MPEKTARYAKNRWLSPVLFILIIAIAGFFIIGPYILSVVVVIIFVSTGGKAIIDYAFSNRSK